MTLEIELRKCPNSDIEDVKIKLMADLQEIQDDEMNSLVSDAEKKV